MRLVEPKVYLLAASQPLPAGAPQVGLPGISQWLEDLGAVKYQMNPHRTKTPSELLVELAGRRCYKSFEPGLNPNVTKVREDIAEYLTNILKSGHGSVLEHMSFTFAFENVSRVFTHELVRHRVGVAISQESMRYVRLTDIPFWMPNSIKEGDGPGRMGTPEQREKARDVIMSIVRAIENAYEELETIFQINDDNSPMTFAEKKKLTSMFRRIAPDGIATGIVWTGNLRLLRSMFEQRCSSAAEEEIYHVFTQVLKMMQELEPNFFKDFKLQEGKGFVPEFHKV